jgi:hypothetical protein
VVVGLQCKHIDTRFMACVAIGRVDDAKQTRLLGEEGKRRLFIDQRRGQLPALDEFGKSRLQSIRLTEDQAHREHQQGRYAARLRQREHALTCVLMQQMKSHHDDIEQAAVDGFWQAIGMRTQRMSPDEHDRALALTSHLPHATAAALASMLSDDLRDFAATGFRDTTRIAAGDPHLWTGIFLQNADFLCDHIDSLIARLTEFRGLTARQDAERIFRWLSDAKQVRERLED